MSTRTVRVVFVDVDDSATNLRPFGEGSYEVRDTTDDILHIECFYGYGDLHPIATERHNAWIRAHDWVEAHGYQIAPDGYSE